MFQAFIFGMKPTSAAPALYLDSRERYFPRKKGSHSRRLPNVYIANIAIIAAYSIAARFQKAINESTSLLHAKAPFFKFKCKDGFDDIWWIFPEGHQNSRKY